MGFAGRKYPAVSTNNTPVNLLCSGKLIAVDSRLSSEYFFPLTSTLSSMSGFCTFTGPYTERVLGLNLGVAAKQRLLNVTNAIKRMFFDMV